MRIKWTSQNSWRKVAGAVTENYARTTTVADEMLHKYLSQKEASKCNSHNVGFVDGSDGSSFVFTGKLEGILCHSA